MKGKNKARATDAGRNIRLMAKSFLLTAFFHFLFWLNACSLQFLIMLSFEHIEYLLALLVVLPMVLLFLITISYKKKVKKALGDQELINRLTANYSSRRYQFKFVLVLLSVILIIFSAANLRKPTSGDKEKKAGIDIMIALDVSKSMWSEDIKPSRLDRARQLINTIIDNAGDNRIGLIVFAGKAYLQMPLTSDVAAAKIFVANASPDIIPVQGTIISDALQLCINSLDTKEKKYKAVILISDGEDHDPKTAGMFQQLYDNGIIVNTVGIGSIGGAPIMEPGTTSYKTDNNGQTVITKLNEKELQDIAAATGGIYSHFSNTRETATVIMNELNGMEKKAIQGSFGTKQYATFYSWSLIPAVLFLVVETFISEAKRRRKQKI